MNMASIDILFIFSVICITAGISKNTFISLECTTGQVGQYGLKSLVECVVQAGSDVKDPKILVVTWKKGLKTLLVFNEDKVTMPLPGYSFSEPSWNDMNLNVSLFISNTAVEDEGVYTCLVMTDSGNDEKSIRFKVTAKYSMPTVHTIPETLSGSTLSSLNCTSKGGYPKGQIRWFDEHDKDWTKSSKMDVNQRESGLFDLSSEMTLLPGSIFPKYKCKVFNASGSKEGEFTFEVPDVPTTGENKGEALGPASKIVAPVVVIGSLIVGLLLVLLWVHRRRSQKARRPSTAPLMGDHDRVPTGDSFIEDGVNQEMDEKSQDCQA